MAAAGATILPRGGSAAARGAAAAAAARRRARRPGPGCRRRGRRWLRQRRPAATPAPRRRRARAPGPRRPWRPRAPRARRRPRRPRRPTRRRPRRVVVRAPELRQRRGVERRRAGRPLFPGPLGHAAAAREAVRQMRDRRRRVRVDGRGQRARPGPPRAPYGAAAARSWPPARPKRRRPPRTRRARRIVVESRVARRSRRLRSTGSGSAGAGGQLRLAFPNTPDQTDDVEPRRRRHGVVGADAVEDAPRQRVDINAAAFRLLRPGVQGTAPSLLTPRRRAPQARSRFLGGAVRRPPVERGVRWMFISRERVAGVPERVLAGRGRAPRRAGAARGRPGASCRPPSSGPPYPISSASASAWARQASRAPTSAAASPSSPKAPSRALTRGRCVACAASARPRGSRRWRSSSPRAPRPRAGPEL